MHNRLRHVKDAVSKTNYSEDVDDQGDDNYRYDAIGNLVKDEAEGLDQIAWTVYGKISQILKKDDTTINYTYDVSGNRISKTVTKNNQSEVTWYVRDAQGNTLAVYSYSGKNLRDGKLLLTEQHLYGSSRLGIWQRSVDMEASPDKGKNLPLLDRMLSSGLERGQKRYELTNHLGNVLATVSDRKFYNGTRYETEVVSANDLYSFGMGMPDRKWGSGYRYGFNGKENDMESGTQDYGFRIYNPKLGRFLSVDPLTADVLPNTGHT